MKLTKKLFLVLLVFTIISSVPAYAQSNEAIKYYNQGVDNQLNDRHDLAVQNYTKALSLYPGFIQAKRNLSAAYYALAYAYNKQGKQDLAIQNYKKAVSIDPRNASAYYNLGVIYNDTGENIKAIECYRKVLVYDPNHSGAKNNLSVTYYNSGIDLEDKGKHDQAIENFKEVIRLTPNRTDVYGAMANSYLNKNQFDIAIENYKKELNLNPQSLSAQHNLDIACQRKKEYHLINRINNTKTYQRAPEELYGLVRTQYGLKHDTPNRLFEILDLMWSDSEGQKLLGVIRDKRIIMNITPGSNDTNAKIQSREDKMTFALWGIIPIFSLDVNKEKNAVINIGEDHIQAFRNPDLTAYERLFAFQVVGHEVCHAVKNLLSKNQDNSLEEELTSSMIGYNIAFRLTQGREMTQDEVLEYSKRCLQALLLDDHRNLPVYNNFRIVMRKFGIIPPHPYVYENIPELYRSIRNDPKTQKLNTLERML